MIIKSDTIWKSGDDINLNGLVQVAPGATLTIEAGAKVKNGTIEVFGELVTAGTAQNLVTFERVALKFGGDFNSPGYMDISFSKFYGGSFLDANGGAGYGAFEVTDSIFTGTQGFYIWYPTSDSTFLRNVFDNTQGMSIGTDRDARVLVEANTFVNPSRPYNGSDAAAIVNWAAYGNPVEVRFNTFSLPSGTNAIELPSGYSSTQVVAEENYFGVITTRQIADLILDKLDDLNRASIVSFKNFLTSPHPDAPAVPMGPLVFHGTDGSDYLEGRGVGDLLYGYAGYDTLQGHAGSDMLDGGADRDSLFGGEGDDTLLGGTDGDNLTGGEGNDLLDGGADRDRLLGEKGNDTLDGGESGDTLIGGEGNDTYILDDTSTKSMKI